MFGAIMIILLAVLACGSVLAGLALKQRRDPKQMSQQEQINMAKASGAFQHRKSNQ